MTATYPTLKRYVVWNDRDSDGINPVLFHVGPVNVYRTCEPVMLADDFAYESITDLGIRFDCKPENVGIHPSRGLVWIDYG